MQNSRTGRDRFLQCLPLAGLVFLVFAATLQAEQVRTDDLLRQAEQFEKQGQWDRACELYEHLLIRDRNSPELKERYQSCVRSLQQVRRYRDTGFRQKVLKLGFTQALNVYGEVLAKVQSYYVDRDRTQLTRLFAQGLDELTLALTNHVFCHEHLTHTELEAVRAFRAQMRETWGGRTVRDPTEARLFVRDVALAAQKSIGLRPTVTVMEFVCGSCNALDEYTLYLLPSQLTGAVASLEGELVGVGLELSARDQKLVIQRVAPDSPAAMAGLRAQDRILRIGAQPADRLATEVADELLRGEPGSVVEIDVLSPGAAAPRTVKLARQAPNIPTLGKFGVLEEGIGYIQLINFQRTTVQEMEDAILRLRTDGMKVLILDLRGNPGGQFRSAVQLAERFLPQGIIVSAQSPLAAYNKTFESHSGMNALDIPLVVLVDSDTASAAEVVAGALKDHQRATLVGQTTFGKGSIQCVVQLTTVPAGLRITVAKFFSPRGNIYHGFGITPHVIAERASMGGMKDYQLEMARQEAMRLRVMNPSPDSR